MALGSWTVDLGLEDQEAANMFGVGRVIGLVGLRKRDLCEHSASDGNFWYFITNSRAMTVSHLPSGPKPLLCHLNGRR